MIQYFETSVDNFRELAEGMMVHHKKELCAFGEDVELCVHWDYYKALENVDHLRVYVATDHGRIFGYFGVLILPHPHYRHHWVATVDNMFVDPKYRIGLTGFKFLKWCVDKVESIDEVNSIMFGTKAHVDVGQLLERLGFQPIETLYHKRIK